MKGIRRCQYIISLFLIFFVIVMAILIIKIRTEADFYIANSDKQILGMVYDRNGGVLFDGTGKNWYEDNFFVDVGNLIGDNKGQMTNTLVAQNLEKLSNYSFSKGSVDDGKAAIYTTLDHNANRAVYNAYGFQKGCAVAYNYLTGEILVCTSLPSLDVTKGYDGIENFESGTLISKNMYRTVPGSTQKISTVISAMEVLGKDTLFSKRYSCYGHYTNLNGDTIDCHNWSGHGEQDIQKALESGAQAVQIGTALLVADECEISPLYKNAVLASKEQQTTITLAFTGKPARGLANDFTKRMEDATVAPYPLQNYLTTTIRKESAEQGNAEYLSMWMGENSHLIQQTDTVKNIVSKLL